MDRHGLAGLMAIAALVGGCDAPAPSRAAPATADKASLYGDPSLVPTRAGERAREEIGLAQAITAALRVLPQVAHAQVDVELPRRAAPAPPRVLVVLRRASAQGPASLRDRAERIATAVVGPGASVEVLVGPVAPTTPPAPDRLGWPLGLGLLGLGFFAGMLLERARRMRRGPRRGR